MGTFMRRGNTRVVSGGKIASSCRTHLNNRYLKVNAWDEGSCHAMPREASGQSPRGASIHVRFGGVAHVGGHSGSSRGMRGGNRDTRLWSRNFLLRRVAAGRLIPTGPRAVWMPCRPRRDAWSRSNSAACSNKADEMAVRSHKRKLPRCGGTLSTSFDMCIQAKHEVGWAITGSAASCGNASSKKEN